MLAWEDYDGLKPFDLAKDNKHQECMKLLFKAINTNLLVSERVCTFISPAENNYYFPLQISLTPHHSLSRALNAAMMTMTMIER